MKICDSSFGGGGGGGDGAIAVVGKSTDDDFFGDPKSWPPGFRFHPTDEELVLYYLKRKICRRRLKLNVIADIDVYKWDPEELPGQSLLKTEDRQWYFFSPRDRKYPNGGRSNRATGHGYWKATGKDRCIERNSRTVGWKKTLVFYRGRAPSGERTDWVMHEYTLDEEELKNCKAAQDCYALYKAYKKSGPGPKNGEQYGAPFREEEWAKDSDLVEDHAPNHLIQHVVNIVNGEKSLVDNECQPQRDLLDEILGLIADEPEKNNQQENGLEYPLPKGGSEEEFRNTMMMHPSIGETCFAEPCLELNPSYMQRDVGYSVGVTHSAISQLPSHEAPEVTSASAYSSAQILHELEENNFLEMNDLCDPKLCLSDMEHVDNSLYCEDPEFYFDAAMFLQDTEPIDQEGTSHPYFDNSGDGMIRHLDYEIQSTQSCYEIEPIRSQLWVHDQNPCGFMSSDSNALIAPLNSGTIPSGGTSGYFVDEERYNEGKNETDDIDTWFSSAVSSFLGSVPARPALASENAILNRAFERMSSFGRVQIPIRDTDVHRDVHPTVGRGNTNRYGGFFFLSILVALCAVCWLLMIGTTLKVLKTFVGSFVAS